MKVFLKVYYSDLIVYNTSTLTQSCSIENLMGTSENGLQYERFTPRFRMGRLINFNISNECTKLLFLKLFSEK